VIYFAVFSGPRHSTCANGQAGLEHQLPHAAEVVDEASLHQRQVDDLRARIAFLVDMVKHIQSHQTELNEIRDKIGKVGDTCDAIHRGSLELIDRVGNVEEDIVEILETGHGVRESWERFLACGVAVMIFLLLYHLYKQLCVYLTLCV
jgi:hypothetical protein